MKFRPSIVAIAMTLTGTAALVANGEAQAKAEPITIVSHVDIIPDYAKPKSEETATILIRGERTATAQDAGLLSYVVLQQIGSNNHFTIIETWRDTKSYQLHQGSGHTVKFRTAIQPFLGSPFDSREHHPFN